MATRRNRKRTRLDEASTQQEAETINVDAVAAAVTVTAATSAGVVSRAKVAATASTATTKKANTRAAAEKASEPEWQLSTEIKLEVGDQELCTADDDGNGAGDDYDVKPDFFELQQEILLQQQLQQQQQQPQLWQPPSTLAYTQTATTMATVVAPTAVLPPPTALLPPPTAKRLFIVSDLDGNGALTLTPLGSNKVVLQSANIVEGAIGTVAARHAKGTTTNDADGAGSRNYFQVLFAQNSAVGTTLTPTTATATAAAKLSNYVKNADEVDMQESDTDEEGYSDIDFDEDDELIEDDEECDLYDPVWTDQPTAPRNVFRFETTSIQIGLQGRPKSTNPIFYFDMLLGSTDAFFTQLAKGCNERVYRLLSTNVGQTYLKPTTASEMQIFFGLCLQMCSLRLSSLSEYWNVKSHCGFNGFKNIMSLKRFQMLLQMLSFESFANEANPNNDNTGEAANDVFAEIQPLLDFFNHRMQQIYTCRQRLVLNEPIMYWKGKFDWARSMREKFRCNAVMLHFITEQSGVMLKIIPEIHRKELKQELCNSRQLVCRRISIAKELLMDKMGNGHTVYISKYYGSYGLCCELAGRKTYSTGLLDCKRYGNSKQLILTNLSTNSFSTKYAASIMMGKCRRREKSVYFFSSDCIAIYDKEFTVNSRDPRFKIIKELDWQLKLPIHIRVAMLDYQLTLQRKDMKWEKRLLIYIFNLMVLNAFILYTMHAHFGHGHIFELHLKDTSKLKSYEEFRQDIIGSLLHLKERMGAEISTTDSEDEDGSREHLHVPMVIPRRNGKAMKKKCRICRKGGMLSFSKLCCEGCPGLPGLCESPCFTIWHEQLQKALNTGERIKTRTIGTKGEQTTYF